MIDVSKRSAAFLHKRRRRAFLIIFIAAVVIPTAKNHRKQRDADAVRAEAALGAQAPASSAASSASGGASALPPAVAPQTTASTSGAAPSGAPTSAPAGTIAEAPTSSAAGPMAAPIATPAAAARSAADSGAALAPTPTPAPASSRVSGAAVSDAVERDDRLTRVDGGIIRGPRDQKRIALVFTGHEFAEGAGVILDALAARRLQASFFLTGVFLRTPAFAPFVQRMVRDGHLVGPHSDQHLLLCPWTGPRESLVTRAQLDADLRANLRALAAFGIDPAGVKHWLPSYEWYNADHVLWSRAQGLTLINYTPGTRANADYTEDGSKAFISSDAIMQSVLQRERKDAEGLNGFILLLHVGAGPRRTDKMAAHVGDLLDALTARGYAFVRVDELLAGASRSSS